MPTAHPYPPNALASTIPFASFLLMQPIPPRPLWIVYELKAKICEPEFVRGHV